MIEGVVIAYIFSVVASLNLYYSTENIRKKHYKKSGVHCSYSKALFFACFIPLLNVLVGLDGYEDIINESNENDKAEAIRRQYMK